MATNRKQYEKPSMRVFELRQKPALLVGSFTGDRGTPYGNPIGY